jgi:uncharacterized integral membrane protein
MKRAVKLILLIPVVVLLVALSVANRAPVVFSLDPFGGDDPALSFEIPLYWLLFAAAAIGLLVGGVATWIGQSKWRRAARHDHAEIERLRREGERSRSAPTSLPLPADRQPVA